MCRTCKDALVENLATFSQTESKLNFDQINDMQQLTIYIDLTLVQHWHLNIKLNAIQPRQKTTLKPEEQYKGGERNPHASFNVSPNHCQFDF